MRAMLGRLCEGSVALRQKLPIVVLADFCCVLEGPIAGKPAPTGPEVYAVTVGATVFEIFFQTLPSGMASPAISHCGVAGEARFSVNSVLVCCQVAGT